VLFVTASRRKAQLNLFATGRADVFFSAAGLLDWNLELAGFALSLFASCRHPGNAGSAHRKNRMRIPSPEKWAAMLGAAASLAIFAGSASAQYDPRYDRYYERYERYDRYRRYDPYDEYFARRQVRRLPRDEFQREPVRHKKPKREIEPVKKADEKPAKGPFQIVVSIASQRIYLYGADGLIRESKVSTGMHGHSTPTGVFSVIEKDYYHRSNIYSGAPMPLMQRITYSGVALHEGVLPGYPASHGCIRMTADFARFLWHTTKRDTRVIVARSEIEPPAPIASPKLFVPVKKPAEKIEAATSTAKDVANQDAPLVQVASATDQIVDAQPIEATPAVSAMPEPTYKAPVMPARKGQVAVFISRKTEKLYVRYANAPLFETPIVIRNKDQPIGTHVFTAIELAEDGKQMKWLVTSIPTHAAPPETPRRKSARDKIADIAEKPAMPDPGTQTAASALDRIEIPLDASERIGELLSPGSSLTISDYGISDETGEGTEFIVLTR
jgi:lipoprotein-anchoring transpeptidase ErfK/SrfK